MGRNPRLNPLGTKNPSQTVLLSDIQLWPKPGAESCSPFEARLSACVPFAPSNGVFQVSTVHPGCVQSSGLKPGCNLFSLWGTNAVLWALKREPSVSAAIYRMSNDAGHNKGAPLLFSQAIAFRLNRNTMFRSTGRTARDRLDVLAQK
jgi:hypothetical protein